MQAGSVREGLIPPCVVGAVTVTHQGGGARPAAEPAMHAELAGVAGRRAGAVHGRQGRAHRDVRDVRHGRRALAGRQPGRRQQLQGTPCLVIFFSCCRCSLGLVCAGPERARYSSNHSVLSPLRKCAGRWGGW